MLNFPRFAMHGLHGRLDSVYVQWKMNRRYVVRDVC